MSARDIEAIPTRSPSKQIFISHSHKADAKPAKQLAQDLESNGHQPWIAPDCIHPGELWVIAIQRGLYFKFGKPLSDEFHFDVAGKTYVGQVFGKGIAYAKTGDWGNVNLLEKPKGL